MPQFLFYSREGQTYTPYIDEIWRDCKGGKETENLQVIGFAHGNTPQEAFENLLSDNSYLLETTFNEIEAIELKGEDWITFPFSLDSIRYPEEEE